MRRWRSALGTGVIFVCDRPLWVGRLCHGHYPSPLLELLRPHSGVEREWVVIRGWSASFLARPRLIALNCLVEPRTTLRAD